MSGQSAELERSLAQAAQSSLGKLPPRRALEALFQSAESRLPAERALMLIAISTTALAVIGVGFVLHAARPIMPPIASAFVLSILLAPAADWLAKRGVPEGAGTGAVVVASILMLLAGLYFVGRPGIAWLDRLPEVADAARGKLEGLAAAMTQMQEVSKQVEEIAAGPNGVSAPTEVVIRDDDLTSTVTRSARAALIQLLFTAALVYFFPATRSSFRVKAMAARPTLRGKLQMARILRDIQKKVGAYMFTMLIINTGLGAVVGLGLMAIGMPSPLVWGVLAGLLNFVPYLGPTIVTLLLAISGLVHFDSLWMSAAPAAIYVVSNFIESNVVTPSLIGVRLKISSLAIIVAIALLTWIWGPVGAVIAIPLVVVFKTICDDVKFLRPLGVLIGEVEIVRGRKVGFCRIRTA